MQLSLVVECQGPLPERTDLKAALPMSLCGGIVHLMSVEKNFTGHDLFIKAAEKVETQYGKWLTLDNAFNANELIHDPDRQRDILNRATFSCVGYHFLNPPTAIKDTLNGYPHALAENIIANIKCITIKNNIAFEKLLWRYSHFDNHLLIQTGKKYDAT
ncbi:hypothetical protein MACH26_36160 [Planctobacterium marinum]|uniref:Uncharacterized protein n=2 Tax=Planctobacterium marinum TaxID=1631968 RepID=A0AA48I0N8_9ALTE|nr:hypothetical protein MACH26_36160 [Planctobacterium marinum]